MTLNWMDQRLFGVRSVLDGAEPLPARPTISFVGATVEDDAANNLIRVTFEGGTVDFPTIKSALGSASSAVAFNNKRLNLVAPGVLATDGVNKGQLDIHVPEGWINVKAYGAVGDGVTDDIAAFRAALVAMRTVGAGTLFVPAGEYYLSDHLRLDSDGIYQGVGTGWFATSRQSILRFAPYKGLWVDSVLTSAKATTAEYCMIRNLTIRGGHGPGVAGLAPDLHPQWAASHAYSVGDKIVPTEGSRVSTVAYNPRQGDTFEFYYECVTAGTSGGTQPAWQDPDVGYFTDQTQLWQADNDYWFSAVVRKSGRWDVAFKAVSPAVYETTPGRSGATVPAAFATAAIGDTVSDGTVTWLCFDAKSLFVTDGTARWARREAAGIHVQATCVVENCLIENFLNAGWFNQSLSTFDGGYPQNHNPHFPQPTCIANTCLFRDSRVLNCGVGVYTNSADSNAHSFENLSILGRLTVPRDKRELGISDNSFLGNYYGANHVAGVGGPAWLVRGAVNGTTISGRNYVEGDCSPNEIFSISCGIGFGGLKNGFTADSVFHGVASATDWRNVQVKGLASGIEINGYLRPDAASLFGWDQATSEASAGYKLTLDSGWMGRGYWALVAANTRAMVGYSNQRAPEGYGHFRMPHGWVEGSESDKRFAFATPGDWLDAGARFGRRVVGDRVRSNTYAGPGKFAERVCTTAGYVGTAWTGSTAVTSGNHTGPYASGSTMARPTSPNGYVYECTKSGTTAGSQPTWPTTIAAKVARTWVATGDYWSLNAYARPSTPNGKIYQATAISAGRPEAYSTTEPTWPTTLAATVTDAAGITWTCDSADVTGSWVADGSAIWTCVGVDAVLSYANPTVEALGTEGQALCMNAGATACVFADVAHVAGDIGGTSLAPTVVGITGAAGVVTHVETKHSLLTANQRLLDERVEASLTGATGPGTTGAPAGPDTLWSLTMPTGEAWVVDFEVVAHVAGGNANLYRATRKFKNVGGTITATTIGTDTAHEDAAGTIDYTHSGTTVRLRFTKPTTGVWRAVARVSINGAVA